jgi:hypothetical protein
VHDDRANGDLLRCAEYAYECVVEKGRADPLALLADIDSQTGKDHDRNGAGEAGSHARSCSSRRRATVS